MTPRRERARELVKQFGYRSDCDLSLADTQWLGCNIESALTDAERGVWEQAAQIADSHTCGGEEDIVCRGLNCSSVIAGLIRKAQAGEEA